MNVDTAGQATTGYGDINRHFLRLCLRGRWDPDALVRARAVAAHDELDWDALLGDARREGVAPLLYDAVRDRELLPATLEEELRGDYYGTARQNVRLFHELEEVLGCLARDDVPVIVLKGAALADAVYGNVAVRPMCDVDLLVRERDVSAALRALAALGYESFGVEGLVPRDIHANQVMVRRSGSRNIPIEIHWALFWFPYYRQVISTEYFWTTTLPLQIGDVPARMLGLEAQLLHLCGHLLHHGGNRDDYRLLWLHDIAAFTVRYGKQLDWRQLLEQAKAYDLVLSLREILIRVGGEWQTPIPPDVLEKLRNIPASRNEQRAVSWLTALSGSSSMDDYPLASLAALPTWRSRLAFLWHDLLFPSIAFMRRRYDIRHRFLVPLCYPYRWLSGLIRLISSRC